MHCADALSQCARQLGANWQRLGHAALELFHVGDDMQRLDVVEAANLVVLAPGEKSRTAP